MRSRPVPGHRDDRDPNGRMKDLTSVNEARDFSRAREGVLRDT